MAPETLERLLVVLVDDWPLIALGAQEERSSVVVASQRVIAASPMARAGGVSIGQRQRDAERLVPTLEVLMRDPAREVHRFEPIVHCLSEITPTVMLGEPGWIALPTRGPARYFGGEEMLAEEVAICLHALEERQGERFPWRCGIADGLFAATLAAERKVVVTPGESAQFLAPLPIALLRDIALVDLLQRLGIDTLGALAELAADDVLARFGHAGLVAHQLAAARGAPLPIPYEGPSTISVVAHFDEPILESEVLLAEGAGSIERLCAQLAEQGLRCTIATIGLLRSDGYLSERLWQHHHGWDHEGLLQRLSWQLAAAQEGLSAIEEGITPGVSTLIVEAREVLSTQGGQLDLFSAPRHTPEEIERLSLRLEALLGEGVVCVARLAGGRGPGERIALYPVGAAPRTVAPLPPWPGQLPTPNPTRLFAELPAVELLDERGGGVQIDRRGILHGVPVEVVFLSGERVTVAGWSPPWPVEERWWDRRQGHRQARLQLLLGDERVLLLLWRSGIWLLEGLYD